MYGPRLPSVREKDAYSEYTRLSRNSRRSSSMSGSGPGPDFKEGLLKCGILTKGTPSRVGEGITSTSFGSFCPGGWDHPND